MFGRPRNGFALVNTNHGERIVSKDTLRSFKCQKNDNGGWEAQYNGEIRAVFKIFGHFVKDEQVEEQGVALNAFGF